MKFYPDQLDFINQIRQKAREYSRVLCVLPTGGGKTFVFTWIAAEAIKKGKRVYILGHRREIIKQIYRALEAHGLSNDLVGFCVAGITPDKSKPLQIMSVDTVIRRLDKYDAPDLLIIDEAHHTKASSWQKIFNKFGRKVLGFTATPVRLDNKPLGDCFETMVIGLNTAELIQLGRLSKYKAYGCLNTPILKKSGGDFSKSELDKMDRPVLLGDCVSHYLKFANGKSAIAFCTSVKHAEHISVAFKQAGITAEVLSAKSNNRQELIDSLSSGRIKVLCVCDIISEGTDIPSAETAILLRPTLSLSLYLQQVGRVLRWQPNKTAIILDHAGNIQRHGFPDEVREWDLKEGVKKKDKDKSISIRICDKCLYTYNAVLKVCPACNSINEVAKQKEIEVIEAELEELKKIDKKREIGRARTLEDLLKIEKDRGYKPGWAKHVFNSRKNG